MKILLQNHGFFCGKYDFLSHNSYYIPQTILFNSFQHIKHNKNDLDNTYSNVKNPNDESNTKMHLFDLAVTLIRSFRCGIHPWPLCHTPKIFLAWMPSIYKKCHQKHFLGVLEIIGCRLSTIKAFYQNSIH